MDTNTTLDLAGDGLDLSPSARDTFASAITSAPVRPLRDPSFDPNFRVDIRPEEGYLDFDGSYGIC